MREYVSPELWNINYTHYNNNKNNNNSKHKINNNNKLQFR